MNIKILFLLLFGFLLNLQGQRFSCGLGANYDAFSGTYGNSDAVSFLYNPKFQFQCPKSRAIFAVSAPFTVGRIISSSRESSGGMTVEIPLNFQVGFNQKGPSEDVYKNNGIFIGGGLSRLMGSGSSIKSTTYMNTYVGFKVTPMGRPIEIRLNYGKEFSGSGCPIMRRVIGENNKSHKSDNTRFSIGISYLLYCPKSCRK